MTSPTTPETPQPPRMDSTAAQADLLVTQFSTDSTNIVARRCLEQGRVPVPSDSRVAVGVVAAEEQTRGHGRLGRQWYSHPGESFITSFATVLPRSLATDPTRNGWLQMLAGVATLDALREVLAGAGAAAQPRLDRDLTLKWPNDVFWDGLKLGGILCELVPLPAAQHHDDAVGVVFGIGLNLALPADRLPTAQSTSLQLQVEGLPPVERLRDDIAAALTRRLRSGLQSLVDDPAGRRRALLTRVTAESYTLGRRVEVTLVGGGVLRGTAMGINIDASLTVRDDQGEPHIVTTGDVGVLQPTD